MAIVIVGLDEVGTYVASLLSKEKQKVILVDPDGKKLAEIAGEQDVEIIQGEGTSIRILEELLKFSPELLIAMTRNDEANFVSCSLAKNLGYPKTIARVRNRRYLNQTRLDLARIFSVDYFLGPEMLVASEIYKYLITPGSLFVDILAHGSLQLRTLEVPTTWRHELKPIKELKLPENLMVALICRRGAAQGLVTGKLSKRVVFPKDDDHIYPGDEITFLGEREAVQQVHTYLDVPSKAVKSIAILGGGQTGYNLAKMLEKDHFNLRIIDNDYKRCRELRDSLKGCHIIHHEGTDFQFIESEKLGSVDVFIACTSHDETNILAGTLVKKAGCMQTIVSITDPTLASLAKDTGLSHVVQPLVATGSRILSLALFGNVTSIGGLYENEAEVFEMSVSHKSKLAGIPLAELKQLLPQDLLFGMIQNRGRNLIPTDESILSPGDTVILISSPKHLHDLEKMF